MEEGRGCRSLGWKEALQPENAQGLHFVSLFPLPRTIPAKNLVLTLSSWFLICVIILFQVLQLMGAYAEGVAKDHGEFEIRTRVLLPFDQR